MTEVTFVPKRDCVFPPMGSSPIQAQRGLREYATNAPVGGYLICIVTGSGYDIVTCAGREAGAGGCDRMIDAAPTDCSRYPAIAAGTTTARPGSSSTGSQPSAWSAAAPSTATSECG